MEEEKVKRRVCSVCQEPIVKHMCFHFGAYTCYSCRAFFRRSHEGNARKGHLDYRCRFEGRCAVAGKTRKKCQRCRYQKCLEAGMVPDLVLSEEERTKRYKPKASVAKKAAAKKAAATTAKAQKVRAKRKKGKEEERINEDIIGLMKDLQEGDWLCKTLPSSQGQVQVVKASKLEAKGSEDASLFRPPSNVLLSTEGDSSMTCGSSRIPAFKLPQDTRDTAYGRSPMAAFEAMIGVPDTACRRSTMAALEYPTDTPHGRSPIAAFELSTDIANGRTPMPAFELPKDTAYGKSPMPAFELTKDTAYGRSLMPAFELQRDTAHGKRSPMPAFEWPKYANGTTDRHQGPLAIPRMEGQDAELRQWNTMLGSFMEQFAPSTRNSRDTTQEERGFWDGHNTAGRLGAMCSSILPGRRQFSSTQHQSFDHLPARQGSFAEAALPNFEPRAKETTTNNSDEQYVSWVPNVHKARMVSSTLGDSSEIEQRPFQADVATVESARTQGATTMSSSLMSGPSLEALNAEMANKNERPGTKRTAIRSSPALSPCLEMLSVVMAPPKKELFDGSGLCHPRKDGERSSANPLQHSKKKVLEQAFAYCERTGNMSALGEEVDLERHIADLFRGRAWDSADRDLFYKSVQQLSVEFGTAAQTLAAFKEIAEEDSEKLLQHNTSLFAGYVLGRVVTSASVAEQLGWVLPLSSSSQDIMPFSSEPVSAEALTGMEDGILSGMLRDLSLELSRIRPARQDRDCLRRMFLFNRLDVAGLGRDLQDLCRRQVDGLHETYLSRQGQDQAIKASKLVSEILSLPLMTQILAPASRRGLRLALEADNRRESAWVGAKMGRVAQCYRDVSYGEIHIKEFLEAVHTHRQLPQSFIERDHRVCMERYKRFLGLHDDFNRLDAAARARVYRSNAGPARILHVMYIQSLPTGQEQAQYGLGELDLETWRRDYRPYSDMPDLPKASMMTEGMSYLPPEILREFMTMAIQFDILVRDANMLNMVVVLVLLGGEERLDGVRRRYLRCLERETVGGSAEELKDIMDLIERVRRIHGILAQTNFMMEAPE